MTPRTQAAQIAAGLRKTDRLALGSICAAFEAGKPLLTSGSMGTDIGLLLMGLVEITKDTRLAPTATGTAVRTILEDRDNG